MLDSFDQGVSRRILEQDQGRAKRIQLFLRSEQLIAGADHPVFTMFPSFAVDRPGIVVIDGS